MFLDRISVKKESGRVFFFVICYFLLHAYFPFLYTLLPFAWDTLQLLGQNINKMKHQILIKHKFV